PRTRNPRPAPRAAPASSRGSSGRDGRSARNSADSARARIRARRRAPSASARAGRGGAGAARNPPGRSPAAPATPHPARSTDWPGWRGASRRSRSSSPAPVPAGGRRPSPRARAGAGSRRWRARAGRPRLRARAWRGDIPRGGPPPILAAPRRSRLRFGYGARRGTMEAMDVPPGSTRLCPGGDVGGTKTLLALGNGTHPAVVERFENDDFPGFDALLDRFMNDTGTPPGAVASACLAIAAPITGRRAQLTNRADWTLDADAIGERL